jgi:hypothetical protein
MQQTLTILRFLEFILQHHLIQRLIHHRPFLHSDPPRPKRKFPSYFVDFNLRIQSRQPILLFQCHILTLHNHPSPNLAFLITQISIYLLVILYVHTYLRITQLILHTDPTFLILKEKVNDYTLSRFIH